MTDSILIAKTFDRWWTIMTNILSSWNARNSLLQASVNNFPDYLWQTFFGFREQGWTFLWLFHCWLSPYAFLFTNQINNTLPNISCLLQKKVKQFDKHNTLNMLNINWNNLDSKIRFWHVTSTRLVFLFERYTFVSNFSNILFIELSEEVY